MDCGRGGAHNVWVVARAVSFADGIGGLERAVSDQCMALARLGWDVTLVAPAGELTPSHPRITVVDIPWPSRTAVAGRPGFGVAYVIWISRVRRLLLERMPVGSSLYLHGGAAGALRGRTQLRAGRIVANPHGMEEFQPAGLLRWPNRVFVRYLARGARYAHRVIATDSGLVARVQTNIRIHENQVALLPNGINVARLDQLARAGAERAISADIVSVGRLTSNKGYDMLARALAEVRSAMGRDLTWVHFGRGPMQEEVVTLASSDPGVRLTVITDADDALVQATIGASRVFVQPSRYEGSSLTTLEAMARAVPCVGTPVGGIPEKLSDNVTGFLAGAVTVDAIAEAVGRALSGPASVGASARDRVLAHYDLQSISQGLSDLLRPAPAPAHVVQVARHIGPGAGVAAVVQSLETSFTKLGVTTERLTLASTGLRMRTQVSRSVVAKLSLLVEVVWFSIAGTIHVRSLRKRRPGVRVLVHGDPIGGDVYVNHGLLKEVLQKRRQHRRFWFPANPMHWFTLARDEVRYRGTYQKTIVCLTSDDRETLKRLYPSVRSTIHVIPNGVSLGDYDSSEEHRNEARKDLRISDGTSLVLFVGHEYERKGLFLLLEALALPAMAEASVLVVGGSPEMVKHGMAAARKHGVSGRVRFIGAVADPRPYYAAADLVALPSDYETGPLVLLEALAMGRPVAMTSTGLAPELLVSGVNGAIVERTPPSIAAGVARCLALLDTDRSGTARDCVRSVQEYDWDAIAARYLALLENVSSSG